MKVLIVSKIQDTQVGSVQMVVFVAFPFTSDSWSRHPLPTVGLDTHSRQLVSTPTSNSRPRCPSKTNEYGLSMRGLPINQHPLSTFGPDRLLMPKTGPNFGWGGDGCIKIGIPSTEQVGHTDVKMNVDIVPPPRGDVWLTPRELVAIALH
ncbi:hypothetical protein [Absidia glauca]|uniref:Uncharacterized protein n=1 Tax=Absidia glauca TaxID=4829 RepID=A0A168QD35_ABSGL|nr:hypothetical protein [Absidia glauca]